MPHATQMLPLVVVIGKNTSHLELKNKQPSSHLLIIDIVYSILCIVYYRQRAVIITNGKPGDVSCHSATKALTTHGTGFPFCQKSGYLFSLQ